MKTRTLIGLAVLAVTTQTLPATAAPLPPPMTSCPIEIRSLEITPPVTDPDRGRHPGTDFVTFRNARTVAASHVTFAFYGATGFVKSATAKGLFSPGIDIHKPFPDTSIVVITSVVVAKADFADGIACHNRNNSGAVFSHRKHARGHA